MFRKNVAKRALENEYVAQVNVDFDDENIEDYYYSILYADDMESFIELARSLEEKNNTLIRDLGCVRNAIEENLENWKQIIYHV